MQALGVTAEELLVCRVRADILKFHAIPVAKILCTDVRIGEQKVGSLQGPEPTVTFADSKVMVNDAMVTATNSGTGNGVSHTAEVVYCCFLAVVVDTAVAAGKSSIRAAALTKAELVDALNSDGTLHRARTDG